MLARQIIGTTVLTPRHAHRAWFSASTAASTQANRHQNNDSSTSESDPSAEISPWRIGDRPGQRYTGATHRQLSESNPATRYLDRLDHRLEPRPLLLPVPFWSAYSWRNVRRWKTQMDVRIDVLTSTKKSLAKILELGFPGANTEEAVIKSVLATYDKTVRADMNCDLRTLAENTGSIHFYERKLAMDERKVRCHRELGHRAVVWNTHHRRTLVRAMFGGGADANEVDAGEVVVRVRGLETHYVEDRAGRLISGSRQPRPVDHFIQAAFRLPKPTSARSNNDDARTQYDMYRARGSLPWRVTAVEDAPTLLDRVARSTVEEAVKHAQVEMESVQKRFQLAM